MRKMFLVCVDFVFNEGSLHSGSWVDGRIEEGKLEGGMKDRLLDKGKEGGIAIIFPFIMICSEYESDYLLYKK